MKIFLIVLSICLLQVAVLAQQGPTVSGTVLGNPKFGNQPLGITVTLISVRDAKVTFKVAADSDGKFRFDQVPEGTYVVIARADVSDIDLSDRKTLKVENDFSQSITLQLRLHNRAINETVTVAAGSPQPIDEVSKTINVIEAQEMRERADFSLVDTLRSIPGFRVQQLGGFGKTASIKTRGLRNQDTAVLIDGVRFRDASAITGDASPFLSDFTLTSVSRVEVLRGSGSSLYGTNAIGGVIDFQTPGPPQGFHGQVSGAAGGLGLGRFRGNISDATRDGKVGFNAGVSRTVYTKGIDGDDDANNTNFQSRFEFRPTAKTNLSARFFVSDAFVRLNSNPDTLGTPPASNFGIIQAREGVNFIPDVDDPDDTQKSRFFNGQFVASQVINSRLVFSGYYSGLTTRRINESGPLGVGFQGASTGIFDGTIHTVNGHLNWTPNSINTVTAGYEYEREKFGNDGFTPGGSGNFTTDAFQSSHTFYAQDLVSLLKGRLQLAGGVRTQFFSLSQPKFSLTNAPYSNLTLDNPPTAVTFDGAASYFIQRTGTKLRAHVGNGYRAPSLFERFGTFFSSFGAPSFVALGDPNLKPEKTIAADGGIEQSLIKDKIHLTAVYFYTKLINTIGFGNVVPAIGSTSRPFGGYENEKGGIARGAEFSGRVRPTKSTDIFASYTFTNSDQRQPQVSGSGVIETLGIPRHQFTLVATQRIRKFWVNFDFLGASSYLAPVFSNASFNSYVYRFRGNRRGDLTAGYNFGWKQDKLNLRLFGTIENVFDDKYFENGFRTPRRNGRVGLSFGF
jgi:vitamin B12 transporter